MTNFASRHIGPRKKDIQEMLQRIEVGSLEELIDETIPNAIRHKEKLNLAEAKSEFDYVNDMREIAKKNKIFKSYIGMGYYPTKVPSVILRNVLENPGWYTQYTPYQAEISQGRLEMLLNFQTMVSDLTGMPIANSSLLDEGTAAAEAMTMAYRVKAKSKKQANTIFVSKNCHPQTIDIIQTRAIPLEINCIVDSEEAIEFNDDLYAIVLAYPDTNGDVKDFSALCSEAKANDVISIFVTDLMALSLLKSPGECGADIVVGSSQRFGVPMGYGGPHAAYLATKEEYKRQVPGRIIGVSVDANGDAAYRMALQTREQHIRRDKATSNICTAQALLANMAAMYAIYHGPEGLKKIASEIHRLTSLLAKNLVAHDFKLYSESIFDSLRVYHHEVAHFRKLAEKRSLNFRYFDDSVGISLSEYTSLEDCKEILAVFAESVDKEFHFDESLSEQHFSSQLERKSDYLSHPVFHKYRSESEMMRYLKRLENKDLSLTSSMIPLGSCTMKLNAASEMIAITWPEFSELHPFAPKEQAKGYQEVISELEEMLKEITQFAAVSIQPNAGAQGEYSGLLVIKRYLDSIAENKRHIVLIPASAHGTNPASAVMAGMKVVVTKTDERGNINVGDLKEKAEKYKDELAALMVTYPSTHGVFEESIKDICDIIHKNGGQVYMDGANMNAQVALTSPGYIGADVCHLNLHKTFAIPHGGGGPGMGPICVAEHLVPFLPSHPLVPVNDDERQVGTISAAPWGSANILPISHAYIAMLGEAGLKASTQVAILNANYIKERLRDHYPILYNGENGHVAHEMIFDCRDFKKSAGVEVEDIAKRLMDYGFHAPTVSFPVAGTLMVEPTESESKEELDRFCDAMIQIRAEIKAIEEGKSDRELNLLKNAPHTMKAIAADSWESPYTRLEAAFPADWLYSNKYWPAVARVDNTHGDRELICTCPPISDYEES